MKEKMDSIKVKAIKLYARTNGTLADNRGGSYTDTAVVILILVVLGASLLAGLCTLLGDVVLFSQWYVYDTKWL